MWWKGLESMLEDLLWMQAPPASLHATGPVLGIVKSNAKHFNGSPLRWRPPTHQDDELQQSSQQWLHHQLLLEGVEFKPMGVGSREAHPVAMLCSAGDSNERSMLGHQLQGRVPAADGGHFYHHPSAVPLQAQGPIWPN